MSDREETFEDWKRRCVYQHPDFPRGCVLLEDALALMNNINWSQLDCELSDYLATDGVVDNHAISLDEMVYDICKIVKKSNNLLIIDDLQKQIKKLKGE